MGLELKKCVYIQIFIFFDRKIFSYVTDGGVVYHKHKTNYYSDFELESRWIQPILEFDLRTIISTYYISYSFGGGITICGQSMGIFRYSVGHFELEYLICVDIPFFMMYEK